MIPHEWKKPRIKRKDTSEILSIRGEIFLQSTVLGGGWGVSSFSTDIIFFTMQPLDYFKIIHTYISPDSSVYRVYIPHVSLVTAKALKIAKKLDLSREKQVFIEEAAMLHDIGMIRVDQYNNVSDGNLPYICHAPLGREILEYEGLPRHALVAERHIGVGISKQEIMKQKFPLPQRDLMPESIEEKIISWADLFFSKSPKKLWKEKSLRDIRKTVKKYGKRQVNVFRQWFEEFGDE